MDGIREPAHVEIIRHKETGKYTGCFVTTMEASHRVRGINRKKQSIIKTNHGETFGFIFAVHKNDLVSLEISGKRKFYQILKLGQLKDGTQPRITLVPHTSSDGKIGAISDSIKNMMGQYNLKLHKINAIGKLIE